uniref:Cytochrome c domain-containing protein n=1 Tax=Alexandrium andersonii TaxID=327968 RepID=A0A7S2MKE3_9DINO
MAQVSSYSPFPLLCRFAIACSQPSTIMGGKPSLCEDTSGMVGGRVAQSISAFADVTDNFDLPEGNVKKGEKYFKKYCSQCHSIYPDNRITRAGQTQLGPTLFNIYGRASGMEEIQNKQGDERVEGVLWTDGPLMNYMKNPRVMAQGRIQMNFRGINDFQMRVDIVHYMKTLNWENEILAHPEEKPASFAPLRWYQMMKKAENEKAAS